jgi:signal transduction histidine kinase
LKEIYKKFEIEKKEIENERLRYNNQLKKLSNNRLQIIIFSLIIIITSILILLIINRKRQKMIEKLNIDLENKNLELENSNSTKDKFFSIIAHDLKSPLGAFKNITTLMYEKVGEFNEQDRNEMLSLIKDSANNVYNLLENLLMWSSSQRRIIKFNPVLFNISDTFNTNVKLLTTGLLDKRMLLINSVPNPINLVADISMINTVIRNLMTNALKFTPIGGTIEIGVVQFLTGNASNKLNEFITFYVKDTGVGIPIDTIENLFRIDVNVTNIGTEGEVGTGLGLILCKEFIEKHGGKIWVESEVGKGTTFYFSIPKNYLS